MIIYTDGACSGNPGPMAIGAVLFQEGKEVARLSKAIGKGTNNIAEYTAVLEAIKEALSIGVKGILIRSDSQLLIRQLTGEYRIKEPKLRELKAEIDALRTKEVEIKFEHILREENKIADKLAKDALK